MLDDDRPELMEHFEVALVAALSADGKAGRSPSSGASVDRSKDRALVAIQASDHPHGTPVAVLAASTLLKSSQLCPHTTCKHLGHTGVNSVGRP